MKSLADLLPPEIAAQLHPDLLKNEATYRVVRDGLLVQYQGQWIGYADGIVVASGKRPVEVSHVAHRIAPHAFTTCVGHEFKPERMRSPRHIQTSREP